MFKIIVSLLLNISVCLSVCASGISCLSVCVSGISCLSVCVSGISCLSVCVSGISCLSVCESGLSCLSVCVSGISCLSVCVSGISCLSVCVSGISCLSVCVSGISYLSVCVSGLSCLTSSWQVREQTCNFVSCNNNINTIDKYVYLCIIYSLIYWKVKNINMYKCYTISTSVSRTVQNPVFQQWLNTIFNIVSYEVPIWNTQLNR